MPSGILIVPLSTLLAGKSHRAPQSLRVDHALRPAPALAPGRRHWLPPC